MDFELGLQPPLHISVAFGRVRAKKQQQPRSEEGEEETRTCERCLLCQGAVKVQAIGNRYLA